MQKNAPLQSNLHENAFNPHLKLNESLACRITHSYIVQEEREEKSILVYFYACRGAELRSFPNIYPCSVGGLGGRVRWCTEQQQTGNCWAKSTAAGSQLTRQKEWSGRRAQLHRETSQESWSPVRHSYWTKKKHSILRLFTAEIKLTLNFPPPWFFSFLPLCSFPTAVFTCYWYKATVCD